MFGEKVFAGQLKRERAMVDEEPGACLSVRLILARDIDGATMNLNGYRRRYQAILWVCPGDEYITDIALGLPNPCWNCTSHFSVGIYEPYFLHVEVYRIGSKLDPGTSNGIVLVGRTRIPVPKLDHKICGSYVLVRPNYDAASGSGCIAEGQVVLGMETGRL